MLNRKLSEYLFYGSLALITIIILLINMVVMGNINDKKTKVNLSNIVLASEIDELNEIVQDNKDIQTNHIYNLYTQIPGIYSGTELTYKTVAMLEMLNITETASREVHVSENISFPTDSALGELSEDYKIVQVHVSFQTNELQPVTELIDAIYESNQIFIITDVSYRVPDGDDYLGINLFFVAIYRVTEEVE